MFESAELGHKISKEMFRRELPLLREALLDAQLDLLQSRRFPVIILLAGVDCAGKGETMNLLHEWMDPRHIESHALRELTDEERERPPMWRYWRDLPPKGKIGIFIGSWYSAPLLDNVHGISKNAELDQQLDRIIRFETMLCNEGALILKFWLHLSEEQQRKRLRKLEKDPKTRWRVKESDWKNFKNYARFRTVSERMLRTTSTPKAPWNIVEGADERYRSLTIGRAILEALRRRLDAPAAPAADEPLPPLLTSIDGLQILQTLDMTKKIAKKRYDEELEALQGRLNLLSRHKNFNRLSVVTVFEGNDAAGKGGSIRRVTQALDARSYRVIPIAAPTEEERAQPYLWRFWRHLPRRGRLAVFDRSWYGRVLVERVEEYCSRTDWMRAYGEINDFEEQLVRNHTVVVKFWLAITPEEQLRRFKEREKIGFKRFKITDDDWRNREKWSLYAQAVCDMIDRTSTEIAPWTLVEANDKNYARIKVLKTICDRLEQALDRL
ncbi:polyphosphate:AMP phosphotransferase [Trichlorobacter ammonificans]|uniref:Polyphosphate:AMP phosphotransferase n=1 Tax=Trichlorobacter ammonificans TaxID=2916410 RepID=A0ABN8HE32_9BACT|nr:polyphosphate:AMP phosphotransferase [Trichlorobacter ammonificans]CAH2030111.1 Polyphosphate:AMP phosphotransferase [Trichlorobacter ammonificans]